MSRLVRDEQGKQFTSPPIDISQCEVSTAIGGGPEGSKVLKQVAKKYAKQYVLGQLIFWNKHGIAEPSASLSQVEVPPSGGGCPP
eukprot:4306516-Pyramimonas_sp.AAC.1